MKTENNELENLFRLVSSTEAGQFVLGFQIALTNNDTFTDLLTLIEDAKDDSFILNGSRNKIMLCNIESFFISTAIYNVEMLSTRVKTLCKVLKHHDKARWHKHVPYFDSACNAVEKYISHLGYYKKLEKIVFGAMKLETKTLSKIDNKILLNNEQ